MEYRQRDTTQRLWLFLASAGAGATGQSPTIAIQRKSDGNWLAAGGASFAAGFATNAMTEHDATNAPGAYRYDFDQSTSDSGNVEEYMVFYVNTGTPAVEAMEDYKFTDIHWDAPFDASNAPSGSMHEHMVLLKGLLQGNVKITSPAHDGNGNMTSATIEVYKTKAHLLAGTPKLASYTLTATYNASSEMTGYQVTDP